MQTIMPAKGGEGIAQVALRLPLSMRETLKDEARTHGRSMNTHIVMCLAKRKEAEQAEA
jgi:predicted HicB family RNase H-like nuclease